MPDNILISKIELQNPRKKTYALYQEEIFLIEITEDTLVHFAIGRGKIFKKKEFEKIIEYDKVTQCLAQSYSYLQRRPHLKKELQRKLRSKKYPQSIIDKAFLHLRKNNYINDEEYIKMFLRDSIRQGKSGPLLIKKKLAEKGAAITLIDQNLDSHFTFDQQRQIALKLLTVKNNKLNEASQLLQKQKLQKYGMSRGFSWNVLETIINDLVRG